MLQALHQHHSAVKHFRPHVKLSLQSAVTAWNCALEWNILLFVQALKNYLSVVEHFADFIEDQFDFHGYCLRKSTVRGYLRMLRFADKLFAHPAYGAAATAAAEIYLQLHDEDRAGAAARATAAADAGLSQEEARKAKERRAKAAEKEKAKAAAELAKAKAAHSARRHGGKFDDVRTLLVLVDGCDFPSRRCGVGAACVPRQDAM